MSLQRKKATRQQIVNYIEAVLYKNIPKIRAYQEHINDTLKNPHSAINRLEASADFKAIYATMAGDDDVILEKAIARAQNKYVKLVEKNIDKMANILDEAENTDREEGTGVKNQAIAVRLANETISAMSIVQGASPPASTGGNKRLDKSSVIR